VRSLAGDSPGPPAPEAPLIASSPSIAREALPALLGEAIVEGSDRGAGPPARISGRPGLWSYKKVLRKLLQTR
jgi:hypothetical protein